MTISNNIEPTNVMVLIVDDVPENIRLLGNTLRERGYQVAVATNGKQALSLATGKHPDLVLLDIQMPDMSGFVVCEKLKNEPQTADIPVIFLTAHSETDDVIRGFSLGGVDYVTKPFNISELLARVTTQIELKKSRDTVLEQNRKLKILNEEIKHYSEKMKEMNTTKDKFFTIIAQDLHNPLNSLKQISDILNDDFWILKIGDKVDTINSIKATTLKIYELLDNLLVWSQSQRGILPFKTESFELSNIILNAILLLKQTAENKQIQIISTVPDEIFVQIDIKMISSVVKNILSNSIKYSKPHTEIQINSKISGYFNEFTPKTKWIEVNITDTGVGISEENIRKLFKIESNFATAGTDSEFGTGLGLILCNEFIGKHGGKIWVDSEMNKGTTVHFTLPLI